MNALVLIASLTMSQAAPPPFQAPHHIPITASLKCDWGSVVQVDAQAGRLLIQTPIGVVTFIVAAGESVWGADGNIATTVGALRVGQPIRVYFHVQDGARVDEVDVDALMHWNGA